VHAPVLVLVLALVRYLILVPTKAKARKRTRARTRTRVIAGEMVGGLLGTDGLVLGLGQPVKDF